MGRKNDRGVLDAPNRARNLQEFEGIGCSGSGLATQENGKEYKYG